MNTKNVRLNYHNWWWLKSYFDFAIKKKSRCRTSFHSLYSLCSWYLLISTGFAWHSAPQSPKLPSKSWFFDRWWRYHWSLIFRWHRRPRRPWSNVISVFTLRWCFSYAKFADSNRKRVFNLNTMSLTSSCPLLDAAKFFQKLNPAYCSVFSPLQSIWSVIVWWRRRTCYTVLIVLVSHVWRLQRFPRISRLYVCIGLTSVEQFADTLLSWHCWADFSTQQTQMTAAKAWESRTCICRGTGISQAQVIADADLVFLLVS